MRILVAPDKFKGSYAARDVAAAIGAGLDNVDVDLCPVADGGEGTADVLVTQLGGEWRTAPSHDALERPIEARYALLSGGDALVEVSEASGLARLDPNQLEPLSASSVGTGELIAAAIVQGAKRVMVACGGSATTDAGRDALEAFDPRSAEIVCLCDVIDCFEQAIRYAPQKGADQEALSRLRSRLARTARALPRDPRLIPGSGSAGGLAGGFWAHGAQLVPGAAFVLDAVGFDERLSEADLVITGEGRLDETSSAGKAVGEVAVRSARAGIPAHAIVGTDASNAVLLRGLALASVHEAMDESAMAACARRIARGWSEGER